MTEPQTRKLSLHERYSVTRANLGFPHFVSIVLVYPSPDALPSSDFFEDRLVELQDHFPLLYASLRGTKTREPFFQQGEKAWSTERIISRFPYSGSSDTARTRILQDEMDRLSHKQHGVDPLWHIALYTASAESPAYLVLSGDHALFDGKAMFNLLHALLAPDISHLPYEQIDQIPDLADTHDLRPGYVYLAGLIWTKLIIPKLPAFIQRYVQPTPAWPGTNVLQPPNKCEGRFSLLELPYELIDGLKTAGRKHGINSLHPILKVSYASAIWNVVRGSSDSLLIRASTPTNLRDTKLGHGFCTANYTGSVPIAFLAKPTADFWLETAKVATYLSSPAGKKRSLELMGTLAFVPDPVPDPAKRDTTRPTGWEELFGDQMESAQPFSESMSISNMGKVDLPPRAIDLFWAQAASPLAPPFVINVVGHERGLRVTPVWREGSVIGEREIEEVNVVWERILRRLADPTFEGVMLGDLVREG